MRMKKMIARGCGLDIIPNSQDWPTKKYMVLVRRISFQILEVKGKVSARQNNRVIP